MELKTRVAYILMVLATAIGMMTASPTVEGAGEVTVVEQALVEQVAFLSSSNGGLETLEGDCVGMGGTCDGG